MSYFCCKEERRNAVAAHATLNGIEFLEVLDSLTMADEERQRTLVVHLIKPLFRKLSEDNVCVDGGERVRNVAVVKVSGGVGSKVLTVRVDRRGDFSTYTLRLVKDPEHKHLPADGFDSVLAAIDFSFKVNCPSDFDCKTELICPSKPGKDPDISYLAKDYASFRQLMLDRMAVLVPGWVERNAADMGTALVELLAYVGDYLSYAQDAIATEAYLGTARRRVSVRRHARLVDYFVHVGCNARAWVHPKVGAEKVTLKKATAKAPTRFLTSIPGEVATIPLNDFEGIRTLADKPEEFELMHDVVLFKSHNEMTFYTWSSRECCLARGSTRATLRGHYPDLEAGMIIILQEDLGPRTGKAGDADPSHRHPVRLASVVATGDGGDPLTDPVTNEEITEIAWHAEDALPFPLCISSATDTEHGNEYIEDVSIALGNIVLVDHGITVEREYLGMVPESALHSAPVDVGLPCKELEREPLPPRFRFTLKQKPLTHAAPFEEKGQSARAAMRWSREEILPAIHLTTAKGAKIPEWRPERDLLKSGQNKDFVVEIESDLTAYLRFGDGEHGMRPASNTEFYATYRVGNGTRGNVGAETLRHIVTDQAGIDEVWNPMPAKGGDDAESIERIRQNSPSAFRVQERAVTPSDYAEVAARHAGVQRVAATLRWTGSWYTVFVTADRQGGLEVDAGFEASMRSHLERYRMAGHDVEIDEPRYVPLEVEMRVCVAKDYFRSDVRTALLNVFSNRVLSDGSLGVFHPDNFTFGQPVYLSSLYSAAQAVAGVASVEVTKFQRQNAPDNSALRAGILTLGRLEIARLDNDPNFPHNGVFRVTAEGGK